MVTVEANGKQEIVSIKIDPEVINKDDAQMLEDLVLAASNEALRKARELVQQELGKLTGGLKIPGMGLYAARVGALSGTGRAADRGSSASARDRAQEGPAPDP